MRGESHSALAVTGNHFSVIGLAPSAGRFFVRDKSIYPDVTPAAVISHRLWRQRFESRPEILGQTLPVNDDPVSIVGVAPAGFHGHRVGLQVELLVTLGTPAPGLPSSIRLENTDASELEVLGRLLPDATLESASAELSLLSAQVDRPRRSSPDGVDSRIDVARWGPVPARRASMLDPSITLRSE